MSKEKGSGVKGLTLGLLIGGAAALLLSPENGKENREKLKDNLFKASDKLRDIAESIKTEDNVNYINIENDNISENGEVFVNEKYIEDVDLD
ncbi:YtxH domain-containing protein [Clostridium sp. D2Q-11]|uniref:YtxH domain-containing protein n=1 Tax=Anaeromonas frigoriresistens TaxID=2683708 RepID=A0A942Z6G6_9FIRM|nr:YtxH domain-containing protein [Anaeromonas frigoriresistens]MBS4537562.1 YtxH domain-containing protein [Anaeromonas frigoriresistens]